MPTHATRSTLPMVEGQLEAIEKGDMDQLRRCLRPDALVWHANDEIDMTVDSVVGLLGHFCSATTSRSYEDRRVTTVDSVAFLQHTLTARLHSGAEFRLPCMMRMLVDDDGLVFRIEEYFDSGPLALLAAETR